MRRAVVVEPRLAHLSTFRGTTRVGVPFPTKSRVSTFSWHRSLHRCRAAGESGEGLTWLSLSRRELALAGLSSTGLCSCAADGAERSQLYDRYFAFVQSHWNGYYIETCAPYKEQLFAAMKTDRPVDVLEVGVGTGTNFGLFRRNAPNSRVTALDPNPEMRPYAELSAKEQNLESFNFVQGYAEQMPFEDNVFDYAVTTQVLCSVEDVSKTLAEICRVVKPGGKLLFFEHVIGPPRSAIRLQQTLFDPLQQLIADGCHLTRDTLRSIRSTAFSDVVAEEIEIPEAFFLAPHVIGTAVV